MEPCNVCYTCEKGIIPTITAEDFRANGGKAKPEWALPEVQERCESCFTCQQCVSQQAPCENCFTKQNP